MLVLTETDQGTLFTAKNGVAHAHGIDWSDHFLHNPEAAGLTDWWNGLLKIELKCYFGAIVWRTQAGFESASNI